mgnify:CR=1 FL=1
MICYTYETDTDPDEVALNGISVSNDAEKLINAFSYAELDTFYENIKGQFEAMKSDGAEALVLFIHWGDEYKRIPSEFQTKLAQKLCDSGVDIIIGSHPHVVQPVDMITSTDKNNKTLVIYSLGNFISNQRKEL